MNTNKIDMIIESIIGEETAGEKKVAGKSTAELKKQYEDLYSGGSRTAADDDTMADVVGELKDRLGTSAFKEYKAKLKEKHFGD